ncbi:Ribosomal large subunit pseudouridine synthase D (23S rRNA pseudouridine(1911/1915/1917) synthase) (rRNA pseudouridylate synthase D) (rRNA-uridine isomerase D) [Durusdinium trenchii]|uniref:Ribosomal large subunit pseudouridine synthase D (23S rRNA pseudouridine(1911/1915/1917) synthase) (rRNA pseudouridylate synthase D) (rRNA-uridine isomerase D) n=1 Tax=Durusdinium trenchii TaxID=1381693 RepID=A0ABP0RGZ3_9DINO
MGNESPNEAECFSDNERAEYINKRVHRSLHRLVQDLNLSDDELQRLGREHFRDQFNYLQQFSPHELEFRSERYRRRGGECGLDHRDYQEAADEHILEEEEDPYWWRGDPETLCFDLLSTSEENLTHGAPTTMQWWDVELLAESAHFVALTKPAGMFVVTDERGLWEESATNFIHVAHRRVEMPTRFEPRQRGICHRLDSHTSGVQIFGKSFDDFKYFVGQNSSHRVQKEYIALLEGRLGGEDGPFTGVIDVPMKKWQDFVRREFGSVTCTKESQGRTAVTWYSVLRHWRVPAVGRLAFWGQDRWFTLVQLRILTGRTHQIRLHMAFLGHPLVGDIKYNASRYEHDCAVVPRIFLHCLRMEFQDVDGETFTAASELAPDLQMVLCELQRLSEGHDEEERKGELFPGLAKILQRSKAPVAKPSAQEDESIRHFCKNCGEYEVAERRQIHDRRADERRAMYWRMRPQEGEVEGPSDGRGKSWGPQMLWVPTELQN